MSHQPTISVIMAAFNAERFIHYAIQSVLNQTYQAIELIVIGDCCTDNTEQVVQRFHDPRVHWYNLPHKVGSQGIPNKEGLSRATGDYIAYLSHDDLWFPWHLETSLQCLTEHGYDWIHSAGFSLVPSNQVEYIGGVTAGLDYQSFFIGPSSWFHRRGVAEQVGNWRHHHECMSSIDQDLQIRIARSGFRLGANQEPSLIKFYAPLWRMLSKGRQTYPQEASYKQLSADPVAYQNTLLKQVAHGFGQADTARLLGKVSWYALAKAAYDLAKTATWRPFRRLSRRWLIGQALAGNTFIEDLLIRKMLRARRERAKRTGELEHPDQSRAS